MTAAIIGWAHSKFGKLDDMDVEALVLEVAVAAIADAGLEPREIDQIFIGTFNSGFSRQDFISSIPLGIDPSLRFTGATRVENACATGSAAIFQGISSIEARHSRRVLIVGVEKMTAVASSEVGEILLHASYLPEEGETESGFAGVFGQIAKLYFQRYGDKSDTLAKIAAKSHSNGALNPLAHMQKVLDYEFCRTVSEKNPLVAGPLRRTDCSLVSDGAAAMVISDIDTALAAPKAVAFRGTGHVNDYLPLSKRDIVEFEGPALAWHKALERSGLALNDISCAEVHDCFTIAELLMYEALNLAPKGHGDRVVAEGTAERSGEFPVNASGGLKAKGHPIGATGVSMHVVQSMQLTGTAGEFQIDGAEFAGVLNMGGTAVANYASILQRIR